MTTLRLLLKASLLSILVVVATTGCMTSALYKSNRKYASPQREFKKTGKPLPGNYIGTERRNGCLSEVYQFETPFVENGRVRRLEVTVPVYGPTVEDPIRAVETTRLRHGGERAELCVWYDKDMPGNKQVEARADCRRIDVCWRKGTLVAIRRFVPEGSFTTATGNKAWMKIPWRKRSRVGYAVRNVAYVASVPADVTVGVGIGVGVVGGTALYIAGAIIVEDPCAAYLIIKALD